MQSRDNMISIWRIVFTYMIVCFHFFAVYGIANYWEIAVDFFFIVSGWLLATHAERNSSTAYEYTWKRIKRLYPEYLPAFVINVVCVFLWGGYTRGEFFWWLKDTGVKELLMIHYWPWDEGKYLANGTTWYLSILLIAGLILYSLYKRFPGALKEVILPIVIISYLTYTFRNYYDIMGDDIVGIFHMRFFRGFSEMGIGALLYSLNVRCSSYLKGTVSKVIGVLAMLFVVVASFFYGGINNYLYILVIGIGVIFSFNTGIKRNAFISYWEKICYSVFLNHNLFYTWIFPRVFEHFSIVALLLYIVCVTLFSAVMYQLVAVVAPYFSKAAAKIWSSDKNEKA
ncbi:MAG: acyltransferase [Lachnospiraceae bacterium]|nr:acyltransferase [Lachnospiraceae bacterium]